MAEIKINENEAEIILTIRTTKQMIDAGGINLFALALGWTEKVLDEQGVEIDNPIDALTFGESKIRDYVTGVTKKYFIETNMELTERHFEEIFNSVK